LAAGTVLLGCAVAPIGYAAATFREQAEKGAGDDDDGGRATTANPIHEAAETE
jgi:hypothetical protein